MNEYLLILIFVLWYLFSLFISEKIGKKHKIGIQWSFFVCIALSPVIGYLVTKMSKRV